jgi:hypothetical protein
MTARPEPVLAFALILLSGPAAQADSGPLDLRVHGGGTLVETLAIRRVVAAADAAENAAAKNRVDSADATVSSPNYERFPTSLRDFQERVIVKLNVGYAVDAGTVSGDPGRNGLRPDQVTAPDGAHFNQVRPYLLGDAVLGSQGVLMPSLNTYFLSRFALQTGGSGIYNSLNNVYDSRGGREILIYAGYAELSGVGKPGTALSKLLFRAGRQFRFGATNFVANFDGIDVEYRDREVGYQVSGFFGRRASAFYVADPGIMGGVGLALSGERLVGVPVDFSADYLFFTAAGKQDIHGDGVNVISSLSRHYLELSARTQIYTTRLRAEARVVDQGGLSNQGAGLGRIGVQVRQPLIDKLLLVGEAEHRFARNESYDFISPAPQDVVDVARQLGIGIDAPQDANRFGLRADLALTRELELYGFSRVNLVDKQGQSGFNTSWFEAGAAIAARLLARIAANLQYKARFYDLNRDANAAGQPFADTSGSGVKSFHEVAGEVRYSPGARRYSAALGLVYRVYSLRSPYAEVDNDGRAGGRADFDYWFNQWSRIKLAGELAQPSPSFARELGTLFSVRALGEFLF